MCHTLQRLPDKEPYFMRNCMGQILHEKNPQLALITSHIVLKLDPSQGSLF
jgi:hypothetical protein